MERRFGQQAVRGGRTSAGCFAHRVGGIFCCISNRFLGIAHVLLDLAFHFTSMAFGFLLFVADQAANMFLHFACGFFDCAF